MLPLLWLVPALPLAGCLALLVLGRRIPRAAKAAVGVGAGGLALLAALLVAGSFLAAPPESQAFVQHLWTWIDLPAVASVAGAAAQSLQPEIALRLDPLSLVMMLVVTFVGFLILLYSSEFMADDEGLGRYFAYMNLFIGAMLILVLADNLLLLYLGWEGVGVCSYLLIGFWHADPANGRAARKAFIVTRIGDTAFMVGLLLLFTQLGTFEIQALMSRAAETWPVGSPLAVAVAALLLGGAVGKSAQLPLQVWLPDAMAGPTPVSALIHAATMVTAGVYLIARTNVLFTLAPEVQMLVAIIGAATLLLAACSALVQTDLKRILAYSTISQIGYMFLALGVGAWSAAIFHFMTHAFFKALLFLAAGAVIIALHEEHNIFKMGGLRKRLPLVFWTFLIGAASLSALPLVTAGFYSKDLILLQAWVQGTAAAPGTPGLPDSLDVLGSPASSGWAAHGVPWLWLAGLVGAFLTALYTFRMVFVTFCGPLRIAPSRRPGWRMAAPLVILAALSLAGGFVNLPPTLGDAPLLTSFLRPILPAALGAEVGHSTEILLQVAASAVALLGLLLAYVAYLARPALAAAVASHPAGNVLRRYWLAGWGFDWLYGALLVRPFVWLARVNRRDFIDYGYHLVAAATELGNRLLRRTESGRVRWYAVGIAAGAVIVIAILVLL